MTQGLRRLRALGVGLAILAGGLSGCTNPQKAPLKRPVGPPTPGAMPAGRPPLPGTPGTSVAPVSVQPNGSTSGFGAARMNPMEMNSAPQPGYQPPMTMGPRPANPAVMPLHSQTPVQPAANLDSMNRADTDMRMAAAAPSSGMPGISEIPPSVASLPPAMSPDTEPMPPAMPGGTGQVLPPTPTSFAPLPPTPPPAGQ